MVREHRHEPPSHSQSQSPSHPHHFAPLDPGRVDLTDPNEAEYWCKEFDCTEAELRDAIDRVGSHTAAVREELCK